MGPGGSNPRQFEFKWTELQFPTGWPGPGRGAEHSGVLGEMIGESDVILFGGFFGGCLLEV